MLKWCPNGKMHNDGWIFIKYDLRKVFHLTRKSLGKTRSKSFRLYKYAICCVTSKTIIELNFISLVTVRNWLINETESVVYQYTLWLIYLISMVMLAAIIVRSVSPQAAGSGVGEMKVVLRGVVLKVCNVFVLNLLYS